MKNRMRGVVAVMAAVVMAAVAGERGVRGEAVPPMPTPEEAIYKLLDGHARYLMGAPMNPRRNETRRVEVAAGQHPFAAVLSCADSRVPVEVLFDQGLGDIFSVRVAGNVADVSEIASLEYGVEHLHIPALVVLGHTKCGAVSAAIAGGEMPPHIAHLVDLITPAVAEGRKLAGGLSGNDRVSDVVKRNVVLTMGTLLKESDIVREAVEGRKLKLMGAIYDLDDGKVRFIGEHPEQGMILAAAAQKPHGSQAAHGVAPAPKAEAHGVAPVVPAALPAGVHVVEPAAAVVPAAAHAVAPAPSSGVHAVPAEEKTAEKAEGGEHAAPAHGEAQPAAAPAPVAAGHGTSGSGASAHH
jgi:carbonic anhydrase